MNADKIIDGVVLIILGGIGLTTDTNILGFIFGWGIGKLIIGLLMN